MRIVAFIRLVTFALLTMFAIVACQGDANHLSRISSSSFPDQSHCRTVKHESGETKICGQPKKVVALGPYALEPLIALGVQPIGFADHIAFHKGDYTNPSQQIPYLGQQIAHPLANVGLDSSPSIESILKLKPDLIVGLHQNNAAQYKTFSKIASTVLINYGEPEANLRTIAKAVDRTKQAEQLLTET
jgi:iron complex transport system substrate-binding protein